MAATINATLKSETANSYVTLTEANSYFETVPDSSTWTNKTDDQKNRALISATRWIDSFVFYGDRCDDGQSVKRISSNGRIATLLEPGIVSGMTDIAAVSYTHLRAHET